MINQDLKNTKFVFDKMKKLYPSFEMPEEIDVEVWTEILEGCSQTDILDALKAYRKNVPYNVAPTPAAFKPFLNHKENVDEKTQTIMQQVKGDFAWERMNSDIEAGSCRNSLYVYRDAERIILNDWLAREIPASIWCNMSYASKLKQAREKGLLNNFDEALRQAAVARFGKDYEFQSANDIECLKNKSKSLNYENMGNTLAAHWSA
ncbi:MAG: hypothetical protein SPL72_04105 [Cyanobacteriota bacterium]|nr:hypothetical protein [Cyanobacteriota bacterium]